MCLQMEIQLKWLQMEIQHNCLQMEIQHKYLKMEIKNGNPSQLLTNGNPAQVITDQQIPQKCLQITKSSTSAYKSANPENTPPHKDNPDMAI